MTDLHALLLITVTIIGALNTDNESNNHDNHSCDKKSSKNTVRIAAIVLEAPTQNLSSKLQILNLQPGPGP